MIPILELTTQYATIKDEIQEAVSRVLAHTQYILGPEVAAFEQEFAQWAGGTYGVGVASGTDALQLALRALGIGPGDEVICPTFTFIATAGAVALVGATPVLCDVEPDIFTLDPERLEERITPRTRAICVVHLYGHPADMQSIMEIARRHNLPVIEDCAQSTGAEVMGRKVGTIGDMGCFSFFPSKNLGAVGDAGLVLTNSSSHAEAIKKLRGHGTSRKYIHDALGTNSRLDELQAAVLRVKLRHLDRWNRARREVARRYQEGLVALDVTPPPERPGSHHVYHQYTIRSSARDQLQEFLAEQGVSAVIYYPLSLHLQEVFGYLGHQPGDFPESEKAQAEVLSLPMYPELNSTQIERVIQAIARFLEARVAKACSVVLRRLGRRVRNLLSRDQSLELRLAERRGERIPLDFTDAELYSHLLGSTANLDEARAQARSGDLARAGLNLWEHFHDRIRPRFFLHSAEVDQLVEVLRDHTAECRRVVREADQAVAHTFTPMGSEPYTFSNAIDWFSDFQGRSWVCAHVDSLKEQLTVANSSVTQGMGPIQLTWEFNCHGHFQDLARAYWISGSEPFASECIVQVVDWSERNPVLFGVNWLDPHTVAVRCFNWLQATQLFLASSQVKGEVFARLLKTLMVHGAVLADLLDSPSSAPRLAWAASLYLLAASFPEMAPTARWLTLARQGLLSAAQREFGSDGLHLSGSTSLHRECVEWLLLVLTLDFRNARPPDSLARLTENAVETLAYLRPPNGLVSELGPALGTSFMARHAGPSEHTQRLLALASVVLGREDFRYQAGEFPCELYWWLGPEGPNLYRTLGKAEPQGIRRVFPEVGLAVARDHWGPRSNWCMLRTMPEEASRAFELNELTPPPPATPSWHDDYLSICLTLEGEPVFLEPGVPTLPGQVCDLFSRICSHTAVRIGREMEPLSTAPTDHGRSPRTLLEPIRDGFYMAASRPVWIMPDHPWHLHRELLFLPKKQRLVIRDHLQGEGEVHFESNLLLAQHLDVLMRGDMGCLLRGKKLQARIIPLFPGRFRYELCKGRTNPQFAGWVWGENRRPNPTNLLRYYARLMAPTTVVLWMVWNPDDTAVPRPQDVERLFKNR